MFRKDAFLDIHSHIIPYTDHGARDIGEAMELLKQAAAAGVGTIIGTPHFYGDRDNVAELVQRREVGYAALMNGAAAEKIDIRIIKGAEVHLVPDLEKIPEIERLAIEGTDKILIELPFTYWSGWVYDTLFAIKAKLRLTPIIAHIDRYPFEYVDKILELDYPIQMNADAAAEKSNCRKFAEYIKSGRICFLGSDVHDSEDRNYSAFKKAEANLHSIRKTFDADAKDILKI